MAEPSAQVPPQSIEDEESILSECLDHAQAFAAVVKAGLQAEHFYLGRHRLIFRAQRHAGAEGKHPDELTTWASLQALGLAAPAADGVERLALAGLSGRSINPYRVLAAVERVIEAASLRAKLAGAQLLQQGVYETEEQRRDSLFQEGLQLISSDFAVEARPTSPAELAADFREYLEGDEEDEVMELPWSELNECVLGGYRRKQLSVLGGWTGMGKTWALDQMLGAFGEQGYKVATFATEMSDRERVARWVTSQAGIATEKLLRKRLSDQEREQAAEVATGLPFHYYEAAGWSAEEICERIILGGFDVAAIDVVNLVPGYEEKVAYANRIVERFLQVAQRANCHIILVSHLNRERDKNPVKPRPTKRDLRQTGMLEANAHAILFLHRDQDDDGAKEPGGELFFDKVRNGAEGSVRIYHNQRYLTFQPEARATLGDEPVGAFMHDPEGARF